VANEFIIKVIECSSRKAFRFLNTFVEIFRSISSDANAVKKMKIAGNIIKNMITGIKQ